MPLEFALRPRLRLDREPAVARSKSWLPRLAIPIALYWIGLGALTHSVILASQEAPDEEVALVGGPADWAAPQSPMAGPAPIVAEPLGPAVRKSSVSPSPALAPKLAAEDRAVESAWTAPGRPDPISAERRAEGSPERGSHPPQPQPLASDAFLARRTPALNPPSTDRHFTIPDPFDALTAAAWKHPVESTEARPAIQPPSTTGAASIAAGALPSCESAAAASSQDIDFVARDRAPDLPREAFARVLDSGGFLRGCSVPDRTTLEICVAVQEGRAQGVSVVVHPPNARISACVGNAVARLQFPRSSRLDVARTHFQTAR